MTDDRLAAGATRRPARCPFCGAETLVVRRSLHLLYSVLCPHCHAKGPGMTDQHNARLAWDAVANTQGDQEE
jgi:hypothetical protein